MNPFDEGFRFQIGDVVQHKVVHGASGIYRDSVAYMVLERVIQQCHGGIQRHYRVRGVAMTGLSAGGCDPAPRDLCEFEVEAYVPTPESKRA